MQIRKNDATYLIIDIPVDIFVFSVTHLHPGKSTSGHSHNYDELYVFPTGAGELIIGEDKSTIAPNSIITIPGGKFHQVINAGDQPLTFYCIFRRQ